MNCKKQRHKRPNRLANRLRKAIDDPSFTHHLAAKETSISESTPAQFCTGHRGLFMQAFSTLGEYLQLEIHLVQEAKPKGK